MKVPNGLLVASLCAAFAGYAAETHYLDELDLDTMSCGLRLRPAKNLSVRQKPLRLGGADKVFARGVGTHVESVLILEADGHVEAFDATVGIDWAANEHPKGWDTGKNWGGASFRVYADGELVADSGVIKPQDQPRQLHAALSGARTIVLEATDCGQCFGYRFGHADWADARFTCAPGAMLKPHSDRSLSHQLGILTPPVPDAPRINGPAVFGARPGKTFLHRIPVSGIRPMKLAVEGLPAGVAFDAETGVLSGRVVKAGEVKLRVTAENARGRDARAISLVIGDKLSLTPPMGWNHWNVYGAAVRPEHIRTAAERLVRSGLADHGWNYVNIDDGWARRPKTRPGQDPAVAPPTRNPDGTIRPNDRFADMKGLVGHIHSLGLKAGIYSSPGPRTCGEFEGSDGHVEQDATTYAAWGFDYLKYDWCSYGVVFHREVVGRNGTADDFAKPYRLMSAALRAQDRDIVHAFCQYGMCNVWEWAREAGAQSWRSHGDLQDDWKGIVKEVESCAEIAWKHTGSGCWCDPDMLVVGYLNNNKGLHASDLTPNEQYTHMTLWCMLGAPLLLGCDLTRLDAFTRSLLVNDEVLAVHQDALGRPARRVAHDEKTDVWTRPLADGTVAVAVVNWCPFARKVRLDFDQAGLKNGPSAIRDLWRQRDLGRHSSGLTLDLPPHAPAFLRLRSIAGKTEPHSQLLP